ncbi:probable transcriptional regulator [Cytophaga hutchinsonii ATCC 33406]|uniref:Probable transcriptional regulator n=2 Tax=Cytophaga hutchinsonii TaxID=985 RepID=A0A6N4SSG7_CYTH3|nr:probable transcriptional regulator [Cytophaga hutchinsonii ATCC 33406]
MTQVKESSTNQLNKQQAITACPVSFTLTKIGGRWKPIIIFNLLNGGKRYGELKRAIPAITEKMLIQHLKELEADHLVERIAKPVIPPHVEYKLTEAGTALAPVMNSMVEWAAKYNI